MTSYKAKDYEKAIASWQKAAAQGHVGAQQNLTVMYFNIGLTYLKGEGVPKDAAKAVEWWQKAATQGDATAQSNLGWAYYKGEGVPKDMVLAYAWANLAAAEDEKVVGVSIAKHLRDALVLSSSQRAEAERLSSNWKAGQVLRRERAN